MTAGSSRAWLVDLQAAYFVTMAWPLGCTGFKATTAGCQGGGAGCSVCVVSGLLVSFGSGRGRSEDAHKRVVLLLCRLGDSCLVLGLVA
jgi:hypothetical protein